MAELTVGEAQVLRAVCRGHLPGEVFDLVTCFKATWRKDAESWREIALSLCEMGYLERADGAGWRYAVTEAGAEEWKRRLPTWRKAYQGSGLRVRGNGKEGKEAR